MPESVLSPAIYEQMVKNHWDAVVMANLEGIVLYANPAAELLYGYERTELIGKHVDIFNAQVDQDTSEIIDAIIKRGGWAGEIVQKRKDGSLINALLTVTLLFDEYNNPIGYSSNSKDIGEIKKYEEQIIDREEHLRTINAHAPHYIYEVDRNGGIIYINRTYQYTIEEVQEKKITDFTPPEYHNKINKVLKHVFETGESDEFETMVPFPDGETRYFLNILGPVVKEGKVSTAIIMAEDITDRKKSEESLVKSQAQISAIINNTKNIILSIDRDMRLIVFNDAFKATVESGYGFPPKAGMSVFDVIHPAEHDKLKAIYERVFKGEQLTQTDSFQTINGNTVHFETSYNPIGTNGEISGIAIFSMDITERVLQQDKLKSTVKEKEVLLAEIHHRLKNNLAVISSLLQIQSLKSENEEVRTILKDSQSKIKTTALVHEMLYENESLVRINFQNYLEKLVREIEESYRTDEQNINVHVEINNVDLDIQKAIPCGLLINEVLTNAYKHAFSGLQEGNININFKRNNGTITLNIDDDGAGLPKDFDLEKANSTGMTLLKTFARQLEGNLELNNAGKTSYKLTFNHN